MNYVAFYPELKVGYTRIVTITTDNIIVTNEMRDKLGASWPFLSDAARKVQKDLDIQEYTDSHNDPMIPHTFVLEPGLKIFTGVSVLAFQRIFSMHLHTLYWKIPPRLPPARAPEEPVLPLLRTPTPE